ncbi:replicative DNA helicase [bacterium]|nr:replicative DNA helicase [bacterium]
MKSLPQNLDAEKSIIYCMLMDTKLIDEISIMISAEDFSSAVNRDVFRALNELFRVGKHIDIVTLQDIIDSHPKDYQVPPRYILDLMDTIASSANIESYISIVKQKSILRQTISTLNKLSEEASNQPDNVDKFLEQVQQKVFQLSVSKTKNDMVDFRSALKSFVENLKLLSKNTSSITGVPTGFKKLDEFTGGFQRSDLIILAARPSMGKTAFALNLATNAAKKGKKVAVFSLEMPVNQLINRVVASEASVNSSKLRMGNITPEEWNKVSTTIGNLVQHHFFIDETAGISTSELASKARSLATKNNGIDMILIDYLQLMTTPINYNSRELEISEISRSLKALAKELQIPVIALSQLNRSLEKRTDKRPIMSDLRESGAIEQDADLIMFIYRGEVYQDKEAKDGIAEIIIGKNRNGAIGNFELAFLKDFTRFDNLLDEQDNNITI